MRPDVFRDQVVKVTGASAGTGKARVEKTLAAFGRLDMLINHEL